MLHGEHTGLAPHTTYLQFNEQCPQGGRSGEGEYTTPNSQDDDPDTTNAATCRQRTRKAQPERRIQPSRKCKQQRNPPLDNKANDGNSNPDNYHSVPEPIAAPPPPPPGDVPTKARVQWPRGNKSSIWTELDRELSIVLTSRLKGSTAKQLSSFCEVAYEVCLEKFGEEVKRKQGEQIQQPNRRQVKKGQLRASQRQLKRQLQVAPDHEKQGLQTLLDDIRQQILVICRAENHRKRRKRKRKTRESFYKNPYAFAKKLFTEAKSGSLDVPQEELEAHLTRTYSDPMQGTPLPAMDGIPQPEEPEFPFKVGGYRLTEVRDFVRKARAGSAPGLNGISYKLYKNCPNVLGILVCLLQRAWREGLVMEDWCSADGVWIPKEQNASGLGSFRPISLLNIEGKIFFGVLAKRMTAFLLHNKYINTSVQKAGIPGFPGCLEHAQMIWNSLMAAKRENRELHVVWLDLSIQCLWLCAPQFYQDGIEVLP